MCSSSPLLCSCMTIQHNWVDEGDLDDIMATYDSTNKGGLTFNE